MQPIELLLKRARVHPEWQPLLVEAGAGLDAAYLQSLIDDPQWLPGPDHLFAAFRRDLRGVRYLLFGESPYPRKASANGIAFYDAMVDQLWSDSGLSKPVNRATSLRNIIKTALLAEQRLSPEPDGRITQSLIAGVAKEGLVHSMAELFDSFHRAGFLMLNATPVLHAARKPVQEAKQWHRFRESLLGQVLAHASTLPTLILWGKIAEQIQAIPSASAYPQLVAEHPYNISFISNPQIQTLFRSTRLLSLPGS